MGAGSSLEVLKVWMGFDLLHQNLWWPEVKYARKSVYGKKCGPEMG